MIYSSDFGVVNYFQRKDVILFRVIYALSQIHKKARCRLQSTRQDADLHNNNCYSTSFGIFKCDRKNQAILS